MLCRCGKSQRAVCTALWHFNRPSVKNRGVLSSSLLSAGASAALRQARAAFRGHSAAAGFVLDHNLRISTHCDCHCRRCSITSAVFHGIADGINPVNTSLRRVAQPLICFNSDSSLRGYPAAGGRINRCCAGCRLSCCQQRSELHRHVPCRYSLFLCPVSPSEGDIQP